MTESDLDLLPAEVAFQRAATAAKYVARKLSAANSLEHVPASRVAELAALLESAQTLYDRLAEEAQFMDDDPALGDTQVQAVPPELADLTFLEPSGKRRRR